MRPLFNGDMIYRIYLSIVVNIAQGVGACPLPTPNQSTVPLLLLENLASVATLRARP